MRISQEDFAMGTLCLFWAGGVAALVTPGNIAAAILIAGALQLLAVAAIWAARDARDVPDELWAQAGRSRRVWENVLLFLAPVGLGGLAAIAYFAAVRPQLDDEAGPPDAPPADAAAT